MTSRTASKSRPNLGKVRVIAPSVVSLHQPYLRFLHQHRVCPFELMSVDQECEHGNLPTPRHPNPACGCWATA